MAAGKVERHVVVEGRIHAPGTEAVGNGPQAQSPERIAGGEAEQRRRRHGHADGCDAARPEFPGQAVTLQAGNNGTGGNDEEDHTGVRNGNAEALIDRGPCCAQQRIRQSQTDKRNIDHRQKQMDHLVFLPLV